MPRLIHPMKDALDCDKLGGAAKKRYTPRFPNGETLLSKAQKPDMGGHFVN